MSPLACSLLALTALLATANAGVSTAMMGRYTNDYNKLEPYYSGSLNPNGGPVPVTNFCDEDKRVVGQFVLSYNGPSDRAPLIDGNLQNLTVTCRSLGPQNDCYNGILTYITQYC